MLLSKTKAAAKNTGKEPQVRIKMKIKGSAFFSLANLETITP